MGKSACAATTALLLARRGFRTGLLDLDFHGASAHLFVNAPAGLPHENRGILPHSAAFGLGFMSIASFTGEQAVPLRGDDISNALIELLTVVIWGRRDFLIVDMPPGIGDELLDLHRLVDGADTVVIGTPSQVALKVVRRLLLLLAELVVPVRGIIENMTTDRTAMSRMTTDLSVPYLGALPFDPELEESIGVPEKLLQTAFARKLEKILLPALTGTA